VKGPSDPDMEIDAVAAEAVSIKINNQKNDRDRMSENLFLNTFKRFRRSIFFSI
jgi:hypothetical protein